MSTVVVFIEGYYGLVGSEGDVVFAAQDSWLVSSGGKES